MSRALTIFIHLLLFGLLVWVCLGHLGDIEGEVAANANSALAVGGYGFARATAEGQRVTLTGTAKTAEARQAAEAAALRAPGVESVNNQIVLVAEAPPPGPDSEPIFLEVEDAVVEEPAPESPIPESPVPETLQVVLDGTAKQADVAGFALDVELAADRSAELGAQIEAALPGWAVNTGITTSATVPTDFEAAVAAVLPTLVVAERAQLDVDTQGIRVDAQLASFTARTALQTQLDALASQPEFADANLSWMLDSPPASEDGCQQAFDDLLGKDAILFTTNLADIRPSSFPLVDKLADVARDCAVTVEIEGHTDSRGSVAINSALSQARADRVRSYLVEKGVDGNSISAKGFGSARPIADNNTVAGRQANRRIEFRVKRTN